MLKSLTSPSSPLYGRAFHDSEFEAKGFRDRVLKDGRVSRESISLTPREGLIDLFWMNYFGKAYVNLFGEGPLGGVDAWLNERVGDGVLLVFGPDPVHWNDEVVLSLESKAKTNLDRRIFFDESREFRPNLDIASGPTRQ